MDTMAETIDESSVDNLLFFSGETFIILDEDGEILGLKDAPQESEDIRKVIDYATNLRQFAIAEAEGLRARKRVLQDKLDKQFDSRILTSERLVSYIERTYTATCESYAREVIGEKLHAAKGAVRSIKLDFATLQFNKERTKCEIDESIDPEDPNAEATPKAVPFFAEHCPEAVRVAIKMPLTALRQLGIEDKLGTLEETTVTKEVMVSKIPLDAKEAINEPWFDYNPGGADTFKIV